MTRLKVTVNSLRHADELELLRIAWVTLCQNEEGVNRLSQTLRGDFAHGFSRHRIETNKPVLEQNLTIGIIPAN
jgi:hypothetical protein